MPVMPWRAKGFKAVVRGVQHGLISPHGDLYQRCDNLGLLGAGNCRNRHCQSLASRSTGRSCILALGVPPRLLLLLGEQLLFDSRLLRLRPGEGAGAAG